MLTHIINKYKHIRQNTLFEITWYWCGASLQTSRGWTSFNTMRAGAPSVKLLDVLGEIIGSEEDKYTITESNPLWPSNLPNSVFIICARPRSTMLQVNKYLCVNRRKSEGELSRCRLFGSFPWSCWAFRGGGLSQWHSRSTKPLWNLCIPAH